MTDLLPGVQLSGIVKRFGKVTALTGIDWSLPAGECMGLVGSSASGKTTLLRIIAGLEQPDAGHIRFSGSKSPRIGMVFQHLGLWPHLTARQHVECIARNAAESLLTEVRLPREAWDRRPHQLSGGEGQRVGLARALASMPEVLLLDEPLAHLDAVLRTEVLEQIGEVIRHRGLTAIFVTHAWQDAVQLCSQIGLLEQGRLVQAGPADELFWKPANLSVARLTGPLLSLPRAWLAEGRIAGDANWAGLVADASQQIWLRPQQLRLGETQELNRWQVAVCRPVGAGWKLHLKAENGRQVVLPCGTPVAVGDVMGLQVVADDR